MFSVLATTFTHAVGDPYRARFFYEQALNILSRPEINLKEIAINNYSENNINLGFKNEVFSLCQLESYYM